MRKIKSLIFIFIFYFFYLLIRLVTFFNNLINLKNRPFKAKKDVLFLEVFTIDGAGYNYRVKKWENIFNINGYNIDSFVLIRDSSSFFKLTTSENLQNFIIRTFLIRLRQVVKLRDYKTVIIRREVLLYNNYGNLFFEKFLYSVHPNIVLDIDDDISYNTETVFKNKSLFQRLMMENPNHFNDSLKFYNKFIVGSNYLKEMVKLRNPLANESKILVMPTCVDYSSYNQKVYSDKLSLFKFGWIGGDHNLYLLEKLIPILNNISEYHFIELIIICGRSEYPYKANFPIHFRKYSLETEIENMLEFDLGLMPLNDDLISRGKCGFKLIQYMGLGIPSIASAITINKEIINHKLNGWLVESDSDWQKIIELAINSCSEYGKMGLAARKKIEQNYSFESNFRRYEEFLFPNENL